MIILSCYHDALSSHKFLISFAPRSKQLECGVWRGDRREKTLKNVKGPGRVRMGSTFGHNSWSWPLKPANSHTIPVVWCASEKSCQRLRSWRSGIRGSQELRSFGDSCATSRRSEEFGPRCVLLRQPVLQNHHQQRFVDADGIFVAEVAELSKAVHEEADS